MTQHDLWSGVGIFFAYNTFQVVRQVFGFMLEGSVEVWRRNHLYRFIEGQTHFGMQSRGAKMSLNFNEANEMGCSSFKFKDYLRQACTITSGKKLLKW